MAADDPNGVSVRLGAGALAQERELLEQLPVAVVVVTADGAVNYASPQARRLIGDHLSEPFPAWFAEATADAAAAFLAALSERGGHGSMYFAGEIAARDGRLWVEVAGVNLTPAGSSTSLGLVLHNGTAARRELEEAARRALRDELTELPNRTLFIERLSAARRGGRPGAVIFVDLDSFKIVNDTYGHTFGDALLVEVGRRLSEVASSDATVARFGGDEFVILLPNSDLTSAEAVAGAALAAIRQPVVLDRVALEVTASAGIATLYAPTADTVLRNADVALYEAKAAGRGQSATHRPDTDAFAHSRRDLIQQMNALQQRNEQLAAEARTDPVTVLPNRRAFDEALIVLDAQSRRANRPYAVVYFDLDFFHAVNRAFDDATGDATLRAVAATLTEGCRVGDVVYRKGGEELVALLPDTNSEAAFAVADRLRQSVRDVGLPSGRADGSPVTISGGVAALDQDRHPTADAVVDEANRGMLLAKRAGRDRISAAPPGYGSTATG